MAALCVFCSNSDESVEFPSMKDLIAAFQIFAKYTDANRPIHCESDTLLVNVRAANVSREDLNTLYDLDFFESDDPNHYGCFISYRFGKC